MTKVTGKSANNDENTLKILMFEYEHLIKLLDNSITQLISMITVLIASIVTIFSDIFDLSEFMIEGLILIPIFILVISGIVLYLLIQWDTYFWQTRLISARIAKIVDQPTTDFYFHHDSAASRFQSTKRSGTYRGLIYFIFGIVVVLVAYLNLNFLMRIYTKSHLYGFIFGVFISGIILIALMAIYGALVELPKMYYQQIDFVNNISTSRNLQKNLTKKSLLIPRPVDFILKSWLFIAGIAAAGWTNRLSYYNPRIDDLFINELAENPHVQKWMIFAFAICWFLIQELILQQAKYAWNDLRDRDKDRKVPGKEDRLSNGSTFSIGMLVMVRFGLGLTLGYLLDRRLFVILLIILFLQIFYELFVKEHAAKYPFIASSVIALGSTIRFLSGVASVSDNLNVTIIILGVLFLFFGFGYIAKYWVLEATHCKDHLHSYPPRPQSDFFLKHGLKWQRFGFVGMIYASICIWVYRSYFYLNEERIYLWIKLNLGVILSDVIFKIILFIVVWLVLSLISFSTYRLISRIILYISSKKYLAIPFFIILIILPIWLSLHYKNFDSSYTFIGFGLTLLSILTFCTYEIIGYEQYLMIHLRKNAKTIIALWFTYFFKADTKMSMTNLIKLSVLLSYKDRDKIQREYLRTRVDLVECQTSIFG